MISPTAISTPRIIEGNRAYAEQSYVVWDAARPDIEARVTAINEYMARVRGSLVLRAEAWRIRMRPAIPSLGVA